MEIWAGGQMEIWAGGQMEICPETVASSSSPM